MTIIRIALDAMGGDHAPSETVRGAVAAVRQHPNLHVVLVGDQDQLAAQIRAQNAGALELSIAHAADVVAMDEAATAVRKKKDASIVVAMDQLKAGNCQGVVAAGSTGAAMAAATLRLGRLPGIDRPAIAVVLPTLRGPAILLDVGAVVDCKPSLLVQFAQMGDAYARTVLKIERPRVGLINIGEEPGKGDERALAAYGLLSQTAGLHFVGNVEGRELPRGMVDVAVCDGFIGNVMLKLAEGMAEFFVGLLRGQIEAAGLRAKLAAWLLRPVFGQLKRRLDYSEYGGALLLGVQGACVIAHGSSRAPAIANALRVCLEAITAQTTSQIAAAVAPQATPDPSTAQRTS